MKKFLALLLTLTMVLSLVAVSAVAEAVNPDDVEDNMTSADNKYELAFVTDVGQLKDKSFNQGTWNGGRAMPPLTACPTSTISPPMAIRPLTTTVTMP